MAPLIGNGFIVGQSFEGSLSRPDDRVQYDCQVGFQVQGAPYIVCMENGQWTAAPVCSRQHAATCGQIPAVQYSEITYTSVPQNQPGQPGHVVFYRCTGNYQIQGSTMVRCTSEGEWSNIPVCVLPYSRSPPVQQSVCGPPPVVPFAKAVSGEWRPSQIGDVITYQCDDGYIFDSSQTYSDQIVCGPDGSWSPPPVCKRLAPPQHSPPGPHYPPYAPYHSTKAPGGSGPVVPGPSGTCPDTHLVVLADFQWSTFFQDTELDSAQNILKNLPMALMGAMMRNDLPIRTMKVTLSTTRISAMSASQMMTGGNYGIAPASIVLNPLASSMPLDKNLWDRWVDYNVKTFLYPLSRELSSALYDVGHRLLANDTGIEVDTSGRSKNGKPSRRVLILTSANRGQSIVDAHDAIRALNADVGVIAVTQYVQSPVLGRLLRNNIAMPSSNFVYLSSISALQQELSLDSLGATTRNLLCL